MAPELLLVMTLLIPRCGAVARLLVVVSLRDYERSLCSRSNASVGFLSVSAGFLFPFRALPSSLCASRLKLHPYHPWHVTASWYVVLGQALSVHSPRAQQMRRGVAQSTCSWHGRSVVQPSKWASCRGGCEWTFRRARCSMGKCLGAACLLSSHWRLGCSSEC
jgi:hypothetical protein